MCVVRYECMWGAFVFCFKQKTAYEMRISDWSSDVCSSDLLLSRVFGDLADKVGARAMLIAGPAGAALAYVWMALGQEESLMLGVIGPMTLLGLSFAVL